MIGHSGKVKVIKPEETTVTTSGKGDQVQATTPKRMRLKTGLAVSADSRRPRRRNFLWPRAMACFGGQRRYINQLSRKNVFRVSSIIRVF
ncbi:MAG: hypothetical protein IAF08_05165 [Rhizobacter sp.]|nr:hypothetical protein [Chlorobiales bacterium]